VAEKRVGIRDLKNNLSKYLSEVKRGYTIVITEHGRPIGQIVPKDLPLEEKLRQLAEAGLVAWNGKPLEPMEPVAENSGDRQVSDLLIEMRE
jgi:prevent-host-death family protein